MVRAPRAGRAAARSARTGCGTARPPRCCARARRWPRSARCCATASALTTAIYAKVDRDALRSAGPALAGGARHERRCTPQLDRTTWPCAGRWASSSSAHDKLLDQFVGYLDAAGAGTITIEHALRLGDAARQRHDPGWLALRLSVVRGFAALPARPRPAPPRCRRRAAARRTRRAVALPVLRRRDRRAAWPPAASCRRPLRPRRYQTLIGLLAVTGMRVGEAIAPRPRRRRPDHGVLTDPRHQVRQVPAAPAAPEHRRGAARTTCSSRDRLCPARADPALLRLHRRHPAAATATSARRSPGWSARPGCTPLGGVPAPDRMICATVRGPTLLGLVPRRRRRRRPGCRCCRPTSGHADPAHTYWYLSAAPELLALAAERLERIARRRCR